MQTHQAELTQSAAKSVSDGLLVLLGLGVLVGAAVCVLGITTSRSVSNATLKALHFAEAIAGGNLAQDDLEISGQDELAELLPVP